MAEDDHPRSGESVYAVCPYCSYRYNDVWEPTKVNQVDYYWEIYSGLYPPTDLKTGKRSHLKISGWILAATLPFFLAVLFSIFSSGILATLSVAEKSTLLGIGLAGGVFMSLVVMGVISSLKSYSFALSFSGNVFSFLSVGILMLMSLQADSILPISPSLLLLIPVVLTFISLGLVIKNRKVFTLGV